MPQNLIILNLQDIQSIRATCDNCSGETIIQVSREAIIDRLPKSCPHCRQNWFSSISPAGPQPGAFSQDDIVMFIDTFLRFMECPKPFGIKFETDKEDIRLSR